MKIGDFFSDLGVLYSRNDTIAFMNYKILKVHVDMIIFQLQY